jgi:hypothetical protein
LQLINALKLLIKKRLDTLKMVIAERVLPATVFSKSRGLIVMIASEIFTKGEWGLENNPYKKEISIKTNQSELQGTLAGVIRKVDVFIGVHRCIILGSRTTDISLLERIEQMVCYDQFDLCIR